MKTLRLILFTILLGCCADAPAANVTFNLSDILQTFQPLQKKTVVLTPQSTPRTNANNVIVVSEPRYFNLGTNASFTATNVVYGNYLVSVWGLNATSVFRILVPQTNGALYASDLLVTSNSIPSESAGYTQSAANGRFVLRNNGWASNVTVTNLVLPVGATDGYVWTASGTSGAGAWVASGGVGSGEANVLGIAGLTNAARFGLPHSKSGVTNVTRTLQTGYGSAITNEGTNLVLAVDTSVISTVAYADTSASNKVRLAAGQNSVIQTQGSGGVMTFTINARTNGLTTNMYYLEAGGSLSTVTNVPRGSVVVFAGTNFFTATTFYFRPGVTYVGQGMGSTRIIWTGGGGFTTTPGSDCVVRNLTIIATNASGFNFPIGRDDDTYPLATNAVFEGVETIGSTDSLFFKFINLSEEVSTVYFRKGRILSSWDAVIWEGSSAGGLTVESTEIIIDPAANPNSDNTASSSRLISIHGSYPGSNIRFKNCTVSLLNSLRPLVIEESDNPAIEVPPARVTFENVSFYAPPTNSVTATNYPFFSRMEFTNHFVSYNNVNPLPVTVTAAIYTNGLGPQVLTFAATGLRTNWLPRISKAGQTNIGELSLTLKDGAGTAGTSLIRIFPTGGATIDGQASYDINTDYGAVTLRVHGTNWTVVNRSQNNAIAVSAVKLTGGQSASSIAVITSGTNLDAGTISADFTLDSGLLNAAATPTFSGLTVTNQVAASNVVAANFIQTNGYNWSMKHGWLSTNVQWRLVKSGVLTNVVDVSAAAYYPSNNSFFTIHNNATGRITEWTLDGVFLRKIDGSGSGLTDCESITYLGGNKFAVVEEDANRIFILGITNNASGSTWTTNNTTIIQIPASVAVDGASSGVEGIAYDWDRNLWWIAHEKTPAQLLIITNQPGTANWFTNNWFTTAQMQTFTNAANTDFSDLFLDRENQVLWVTQDEGGTQTDRIIGISLLTSNIIANILCTNFGQLEGVSVTPDGYVIAAGEANQFAIFEPVLGGLNSGISWNNWIIDTNTPALPSYNYGLSVGRFGVYLTNWFSTNITLDFPQIEAQTETNLQFSLGWATSAYEVTVTPSTYQAGVTYSAQPSNGVIYVRGHNYSTTAKDPASAGFRVSVFGWK